MGTMMKTLSRIGLFVVCILIAGIAIAIGVQALANHYLVQTKATLSSTCTKQGKHYTVAIVQGLAAPANTIAKRCDVLTITNNDNAVRLMAFGLHEKHEPYDGITEKVLSKNQSLTVTLVQTGNFRFHDHLDNSSQGTFTVN
jgi:uncharacterized membrane protein YukC